MSTNPFFVLFKSVLGSYSAILKKPVENIRRLQKKSVTKCLRIKLEEQVLFLGRRTVITAGKKSKISIHCCVGCHQDNVRGDNAAPGRENCWVRLEFISSH